MHINTHFFTLLLPFFFVIQPIAAQQSLPSKDLGLYNSHVPIKLLTETEDAVYVVRRRGSTKFLPETYKIQQNRNPRFEVYIDKLDKENNLLKTKELSVTVDEYPKFSIFETAVQTPDGVFIIYSAGDFKTDEVTLFAREFDLENLELTGEPININNVSLKNITHGERAPQLFEFAHSPNKALTVVVTRTRTKGGEGIYEFNWLDASMEKVETKMITTAKNLWYADYALDKAGNLAMLQGKFMGDPGFFAIAPQYSLQVFGLDDDQPEKIDWAYGEISFQDPRLKITPENKLLVASYYGDILFTTAFYNGYYLAQFDLNTSKFDFQNLKTFEQELIEKYPLAVELKERKKRAKRKLSPGIANLQIRDVEFTPSGRILLIGEQTHVRGLYDDKGRFDGKTGYAYNIVVGSFKANGDLEWIDKIPKNQKDEALDMDFLSFKHTVKGEDLHLYFNDHKNNMGQPGNSQVIEELPLFETKGSKHTVCAVVSPDGTYSKSEVSGDVNDTDAFPMPLIGFKLESGALLTYSIIYKPVWGKKVIKQHYVLMNMN